MEINMSYVFPVADEEKLLGSAVIVSKHEKYILLATVLHLFGKSDKIQVVIPPHGGDCSKPQSYPFDNVPTILADIIVTDPFRDLAILSIKPDNAQIPLPKIARQSGQIPVSSKLAVLGYPFAPLGSILETWTPGYVTALAKRKISNFLEIDEIVLSNQAHPGSSGSAVVGLNDGILYGILRGSLSPPEVMKVGNIPIATDTSVTYATSAHYLLDLIEDAKNKLDE